MSSKPTSPAIDDFSSLRSVHIIGICGTLMGSFAVFLKRRGVHVTGSDQSIYPPMSDVLRAAGIPVFEGYSPAHLVERGERPDLVVIGNVITAQNQEAQAAIQQGYPYASLPETMERFLLTQTRNIVVAGTHGKTTTSSLLAHVLVRNGRDPSYFIGGVAKDLPASFHVSRLEPGQLFVLEGDEYDTAFWDKVPKFYHYRPQDVILTSVEYDHADIYPSFNAVVKAFEGLLSRIHREGRLIACVDDPTVRDLVARAGVPVLTYGDCALAHARFSVRAVRVQEGWTCFEIWEGDCRQGEYRLRIPGRHNALNALAVWIEARELGLSVEGIAAAFESFQGVRRRQEVAGEVRGVLVIDDFAHHPTAVRETLRALRERYPGRRLIAVFEPRSATSRRKVFQKDYIEAFFEADRVFIAVPYDQSRIAPEQQFSSEQLVSDLVARGKKADFFPSVEVGVEMVAAEAQSGDVVAVLSNGGFGGFIHKLLKAL